MLIGIRNIVIFNSAVTVLCVLNFYLPISADNWQEIKVTILISTLFLILSGPILLFRNRFIWMFVRFMCYFNALVFVLYFISLLGKGLLFSFPVQTLYFLVVGIYFIGLRGYLNLNPLRVVYGAQLLDSEST